MSSACKNRPLFSSNKIIWYYCPTRTCCISTINSANFLNTGHHGDCSQWQMNIYLTYLFCLLCYNVYFRSLDAEKIMQVSFCNLHSAVVYSWSDLTLYEVANDKIGRVSWFNHFIGRFSRATKPRPQKVRQRYRSYDIALKQSTQPELSIAYSVDSITDIMWKMFRQTQETFRPTTTYTTSMQALAIQQIHRD